MLLVPGMRTLLAIGLSTFALLPSSPDGARAEPPSRFDVPARVAVVEPARRPDAPTHELVLVADVVARPGETPAEALSRALHASDEPPRVAGAAARRE